MAANKTKATEMTDKEKAECFCQLHRDQLDRFKHTRDMGFKVNLTLWTFIIVAGYTIKNELDIDSFVGYYLFTVTYLGIGCILGYLYYFGWWKDIYNSQIDDKAIGIQYRNEINKLTGITLNNSEGKEEFEDPYPYKPVKKVFGDKGVNKWIRSEGGITLFLYVCIYIYLII